jgi:maleate cis-trans isomerase
MREDEGFEPARARIGVILPSSNRLMEPQMQRYAPAALGVHFARLRMTGPFERPLVALADDLSRAAETLADARVDLIAFNCAATSMKEGPEGEAFLLDRIRAATGRQAVSTASCVVEALRALGARTLTLVTPYVSQTNQKEKRFFAALGLDVVHDVALGLAGGDDYIRVPPSRWVEVAREADRAEAQACFMSCTNTTQIEAIDAIEAATGKPAVAANQAVLWACLRLLAPKLGGAVMGGPPGRLARRLETA